MPTANRLAARPASGPGERSARAGPHRAAASEGTVRSRAGQTQLRSLGTVFAGAPFPAFRRGFGPVDAAFREVGAHPVDLGPEAGEMDRCGPHALREEHDPQTG